MQTMYNLEKMWGEILNDPVRLARAEFVKTHFIDQGKMGVQSGEGFYQYTNPAYEQSDFLK